MPRPPRGPPPGGGGRPRCYRRRRTWRRESSHGRTCCSVLWAGAGRAQFVLAPPAGPLIFPSSMPESSPQLVRAWLDSLASGLAEFDRDWAPAAAPGLQLGAGGAAVVRQAPAEAAAMGRAFGYFLPAPGQISFVLPLQQGSGVDPAADLVYVAGDFNGWQQAVGNPDWELHSEELDGEQVLRWTGPAARVQWPERRRFKFLTGEHQWLALPGDAPNADDDGQGNINRYLDAARSGRHLWRFILSAP